MLFLLHWIHIMYYIYSLAFNERFCLHLWNDCILIMKDFFFDILYIFFESTLLRLLCLCSTSSLVKHFSVYTIRASWLAKNALKEVLSLFCYDIISKVLVLVFPIFGKLKEWVLLGLEFLLNWRNSDYSFNFISCHRSV